MACILISTLQIIRKEKCKIIWIKFCDKGNLLQKNNIFKIPIFKLQIKYY